MTSTIGGRKRPRHPRYPPTDDHPKGLPIAIGDRFEYRDYQDVARTGIVTGLRICRPWQSDMRPPAEMSVLTWYTDNPADDREMAIPVTMVLRKVT